MNRPNNPTRNKVNRKKTPQPQVCNMFTLETVAKNIQEKTILYTELGRTHICLMYTHISSSFYTHVSKHRTIKFVTVSVVSQTLHISLSWRGKKKKKLAWLDSPWITARRSSCCVSATMFSLQLCDLKWQEQRHQNRKGRRLLLVSRPQMGFPSPFGHLSKSQPQRRERTNPTAPQRKVAGPPHLPCPPGSTGRQDHKRGQASETAWRKQHDKGQS